MTFFFAKRHLLNISRMFWLLRSQSQFCFLVFNSVCSCHLQCTDPGSVTDLKMILVENSDFVTNRLYSGSTLYVHLHSNLNVTQHIRQTHD